MRYAVTIEPVDQYAYPSAAVVRSTVDAADKDAALDTAEASYRRTYPGIGRLKVRVVRLHPQS